MSNLLLYKQIMPYRVETVRPTRRWNRHLMRPVEGDVWRYSVRNDKLYFYVPRPKAMRDLLNEKYPQEKHIVVRHTCANSARKESCYDELDIIRLDEAVLKILSEIPNSDAYWEVGVILTRVRN